MNGAKYTEYRRLRARGWCASDALRAAKIEEKWVCAGPLVKLVAEPDEDGYDTGDMFDPNCNPRLSLKRLERERRELFNRIDREGCWVFVAYYRANEASPWQMADSCGGFIGDDCYDSGYDGDLKLSALEGLDRERGWAAEELAGRATYASVL